jgi:hypothetical protein
MRLVLDAIDFLCTYYDFSRDTYLIYISCSRFYYAVNAASSCTFVSLRDNMLDRIKMQAPEVPPGILISSS